VLVEFAIITPLLAVLMCAIIDFALAMFTLNNLTNAVRQAARAAAVKPQTGTGAMTSTAVSADVCNSLSFTSRYTLAQCQSMVSLDTAGMKTGAMFKVTIDNFYYRPVTWVAPLFKMDSIKMKRTAAFRWELSDP
jgi:Flp pilus assembly protein TadG